MATAATARARRTLALGCVCLLVIAACSVVEDDAALTEVTEVVGVQLTELPASGGSTTTDGPVDDVEQAVHDFLVLEANMFRRPSVEIASLSDVAAGDLLEQATIAISRARSDGIDFEGERQHIPLQTTFQGDRSARQVVCIIDERVAVDGNGVRTPVAAAPKVENTFELVLVEGQWLPHRAQRPLFVPPKRCELPLNNRYRGPGLDCVYDTGYRFADECEIVITG